MENCLIKKFKGTVNDSDLYKYGELRIVISAHGAYTFDVKAMNNVMEVTSGSRNNIIAQGDTVQLPWTFVKGTGVDGTVTFSVDQNYGENDIRFIDKKNISDIVSTNNNVDSFYIRDISDLASIESLKTLTLQKVTTDDPDGIDISLFKNLQSLTKLSFTYTNIYGSLSDLPASCTNLSCNWRGSTIRNPKFTGNIVSALGGRTTMTYIGIQGSACTGDIADFADAQVANGKTSGSITVRTSATNCTNSAGSKLDGSLTFTTDTTTYPRGWYWTDLVV